MKKVYLFLILACAAVQQAYANCPGCLTELPENLPEDTIFLTSAPDGQVGKYYEGDLSFRMPKTTTPVNASDPDTPAGLPISSITISSVTNVPPGLSWEPNQSEFDVSEMTDGCVRFCGVPLIPGYYEVEVIITAQVLLASRTSSFSFPILILPGESVSDGFTIENNAGCGEVLASFINNVPSNGKPGFTYFWDFGNGNSSTEEDPAPQLYEEPGEYGVSYQVIVDTVGYLLTEVVVEEASCSDLFGGAPDIVLEIYNPFGEKIYFTDEVQNADFPLTFEPNIFIEDGPYEIRVIDDDQGLDGGDDLCGSFGFVKTSNGTLTDDGATVSIEVLHPVDTLRSEGVVTVYEQPAQPELIYPEPATLCEGDTLPIQTNYGINTQWYRDTTPILGANSSIWPATESGRYWVVYTNSDGCSAVSDTLNLSFGTVPSSPVFENMDNLLTLFEPEILPDHYSLQWFFNDDLLPGETGQEYCINKSGTYGLQVTDLDTGCSNYYSQPVIYDEGFPNCMPVSATETQALPGLKVYPTLLRSDELTLEGQVPAGRVWLQLYNAQGQLLRQQEIMSDGLYLNMRLQLPPLAKGYHLLRVRAEGQERAFPFLRM